MTNELLLEFVVRTQFQGSDKLMIPNEEKAPLVRFANFLRQKGYTCVIHQPEALQGIYTLVVTWPMAQKK